MRVLLTSVGSAGDINPFIALGRALLARGHNPTLLVNPYFEASVRAAGLGFEPLGERLSPTDVAEQMPLCFSRAFGAWMLIRHWFAPMVPQFLDRLSESIDRVKPDILVGHQISFGLPWVARERRIPWATCVLSPATLLSAVDPSRFPIGTDLHAAPMWYRRFAHFGARRAISFMLDRPLNIHRKARGMPPFFDAFWTEMFSGEASFGLWSPALRPRAADDAERFDVCGYAWHDRSALHGEQGQRLDPMLERFLDAGEPPIIFTLGSVLSHQGGREFDTAAKACAILGKRGVLVTGRGASAPTNLPKGVIALDYAPYGLLMPRGAATVHHGGAGTTAQALRAGTPSIIMPFAHDQFDHAARVERLGVGRWLPLRKLSAQGLARTLDELMSDHVCRQRAREMGDLLSREDGAARAAELLESPCSTRA